MAGVTIKGRRSERHLQAALLALLTLGGACEKGGDGHPDSGPPSVHPVCEKDPHARQDAHTPRSLVTDWGLPHRLPSPINTLCPEDAVEISRDGDALHFLFTTGLLSDLTPEEVISRPNGTYRARRSEDGGAFAEPVYYDLDAGTDAALDGAPSFAWDGSFVVFHSLRAGNTGYQRHPPTDDILDVYWAPLAGGVPGAASNLGPAVNSEWPDGEPAIAPGDSILYFTSERPGGAGGDDIWMSVRRDGVWAQATVLPPPVNSIADDTQPAFSASGDTLYFVSNRDGATGTGIYRCARAGDAWGEPELVIAGIVGEPSLTADGRVLYFVHVLTDAVGLFDADIWSSERVRP
ncbi:MAG: hypothetical protein FJY88_10915 [Candidatus Eisenbacteria bacterium]|nr:hypothetical protein [Candidatus Eisenbacteria bacterium]